MIYTCDCCNSIFECPETEKVIPCPYCGRIKHDVLTSYGFATKIAVRKASEKEQQIYLDPKGYKRPQNDDAWKAYLDDPHMAAYADIDIRDIPDERVVRQYLKTGIAPSKTFERYVDRIRQAYYDLEAEMAMYDRMYFDPEELAW